MGVLGGWAFSHERGTPVVHCVVTWRGPNALSPPQATPTPYTLHPKPCTINPAPNTLHSLTHSLSLRTTSTSRRRSRIEEGREDSAGSNVWLQRMAPTSANGSNGFNNGSNGVGIGGPVASGARLCKLGKPIFLSERQPYRSASAVQPQLSPVQEAGRTECRTSPPRAILSTVFGVRGQKRVSSGRNPVSKHQRLERRGHMPAHALTGVPRS